MSTKTALFFGAEQGTKVDTKKIPPLLVLFWCCFVVVVVVLCGVLCVNYRSFVVSKILPLNLPEREISGVKD